MKHAGLEKIDLGNTNILSVIGYDPNCEIFNPELAACDPENEIDIDDANRRAHSRRIQIDLGDAAIRLLDDDQTESLKNRITIITSDNEIMINKTSDFDFPETITKDVEVLDNKLVVKLPIIVNENIVESLVDIGVDENSIKSIEFELCQDTDNHQCCVSEVKTNLTKNQIIKKLADENNQGLNFDVDDFYFKAMSTNSSQAEVAISDAHRGGETVISRFVLSLSKRLKKLIGYY